jgi:hypothetical protein
VVKLAVLLAKGMSCAERENPDRIRNTVALMKPIINRWIGKVNKPENQET